MLMFQLFATSAMMAASGYTDVLVPNTGFAF